MSGLNSFLNENRTPVGTLTMSSPDGQGGFGAGAQSSGQEAQSSDSSRAQQTASLGSTSVTDSGDESVQAQSGTYSTTTGEGRLISLVA